MQADQKEYLKNMLAKNGRKYSKNDDKNKSHVALLSGTDCTVTLSSESYPSIVSLYTISTPEIDDHLPVFLIHAIRMHTAL